MASYPSYSEFRFDIVGGDQDLQVDELPLTAGVKVGYGMHIIRGANGVAAPTTGSDSAAVYMGLCYETVDNSAAGLGDGSSSVKVLSYGRVRVRSAQLNSNLSTATAPQGKPCYVSSGSNGAEFCLSGGAAGSFAGVSGSTGGTVLIVPVTAVPAGYVEKIHGDGTVEIVLRSPALTPDSR